MKTKLFLLIALLCSLTMTAETYTIVFNSGYSDSTKETDDINSIIFSATDNCVSSIIKANKIYRAKEGYGIKGGTTGLKGELTIGLDTNYTISSLTVYAASFAHKDDSVSTYNKDKSYKVRRGIVINGEYFAWEEGHRAEIRPYTLTFDPAVPLNQITISSDTAKSNRWYAQKIEFEAENPNPSKVVLGMQYAALAFEAASWISAEEPMEDATDFYITGKNIASDISLSIKSSSSKFTLTQTALPSTGGEVSVSYSISMSAPPSQNAAVFKDTIIVSATGKDDITYTRKLPVEVTVKPQSSGARAFILDTTRMAIGPMPGDYYKYAQNTADSTLKNHLGYIICTGQRYKYGSGSKKSWDAFFHTDRDTVTNEVLDMYSNNHRYFNPENPTASVKDFDIEHMLPKSWWGGDVNPAYCDIYHLVPGDYSANRSKSNHAPGIPSDSTFNNGSFVTGSGAAYGLTRVFCPEDQYKGDFARAYFYIATCYGDSLEWLTTGEPGIAMTNEGWEEFRPWLRDLLLSWHRLDPVSKKELDRAIEVNKIQGNRNPFIDYPDLVEYIWGNKKGTSVDFYSLNQSYGNQYDDKGGTGIDQNSENTYIVRKEIRNGQLFIIRQDGVYTPMGQKLQ